jgi:hypothetical protein
MILDVLVHDHLVLLIWVCGEARHHGHKHMVKENYSSHEGWKAKGEKGRESSCQYTIQGHAQ